MKIGGFGSWQYAYPGTGLILSPKPKFFVTDPMDTRHIGYLCGIGSCVSFPLFICASSSLDTTHKLCIRSTLLNLRTSFFPEVSRSILLNAEFFLVEKILIIACRYGRKAACQLLVNGQKNKMLSYACIHSQLQQLKYMYVCKINDKMGFVVSTGYNCNVIIM